MSTDSTITSYFPYKTLTLLPDERPTQNLLRKLHGEINANAIAVPSDGGNSLLGHLGVVVTPAEYLLASNNIPYDIPINPGQRATYPVAARPAVVNAIDTQFRIDKEEYKMYTRTEAALKALLIAAVPTRAIQVLCNDRYLYSTLTTLDILTHLDTEYGKVGSTELSQNFKHMNKPWTTNEAIEDLFARVSSCCEFAEATDPISEKTKTRSITDNLEATGLFTTVINTWYEQPEADQTFDNLMTTIIKADKARQRSLTMRGAGYHSAATMTQKLCPTIVDTANSTITATTTNTDPTYYYCWSHGLGRNPNHTSITCQSPAPGHRTAAVMHNMLGGNNWIQRQKGETPVYVRTSPTKRPTTTSTTTSSKRHRSNFAAEPNMPTSVLTDPTFE